MPDAEVKFFLTASVDIRAKRRQKDYEEQGIMKSLKEIEEELRERDEQDMSRERDPLVQLPDAHTVDTSGDSISQQVEQMYEIITKYI